MNDKKNKRVKQKESPQRTAKCVAWKRSKTSLAPTSAGVPRPAKPKREPNFGDWWKQFRSNKHNAAILRTIHELRWENDRTKILKDTAQLAWFYGAKSNKGTVDEAQAWKAYAHQINYPGVEELMKEAFLAGLRVNKTSTTEEPCSPKIDKTKARIALETIGLHDSIVVYTEDGSRIILLEDYADVPTKERTAYTHLSDYIQRSENRHDRLLYYLADKVQIAKVMLNSAPADIRDGTISREEIEWSTREEVYAELLRYVQDRS